MALSYKNDEQQDERLDPYSEQARKLRQQENDNIPGYDRASDGLDDHPITAGDASGKSGDLGGSDTTKNIDDVKDKEEDGGGWKNNVTADSKKQQIKGKGIFKRKGPMGLIIGLLLGGGGGLSFLFSPGIAIVQFKEAMVNKFNDQLPVMDARTTAMLKKKFGGTTKGVCGTKITIRCRFNTISDRQLKKLEKAGIKVNKSGDTLLGRNKIDSLEFDGKTIKAAELSSELRSNVAFRSAMIKGYNPKLAGFADATFTKLAKKLGINKKKNILGETEQEQRESVIDSASGEDFAEADAKVSISEEVCESGEDCVDGKRTIYIDEESGEHISKEEYDKRLSASSALKGELEARKALTETGGKLTKATLKGALTSTALGLGAVDNACTGYTLIRTVSFAAKYLGALQLLRYANVFMNTADSIKAGDATPGQVEYAGKILTAVNSEGKAAFDSYGYKYAAYGDTPPMPRSDNVQAESVDADGNNVKLSEEEQKKIEINDETTKYINGQLVSDNLLTSGISFTGKSGSTDQIDDFCGFVKSGWGQAILIGTAVVGAVVAFFSGGVSLGWGTAAQVAVGVSISIAMAMLTPKLIAMASGTMIGDDELKNGNRTSNAATSGMGFLNDQTSAARGVPAIKKEAAVAYQELTDQTMAQYKAVDQFTANPLDPSNPNTFMGSIVSKILPYTTKVSSLSGGLNALTSFTASSMASILPTTHAADKNAEFSICEDKDYKELGLAVDPFCNIKHGLKKETLNTDSDEAVNFMVGNGYVDEETGQPKEDDNDYANYIKNCMDRTVSLGGFTEDNKDKGEQCIQDSASGDEEHKRNMFRIFFIDMSIDEGMENGEAAGDTQAVAAPTNGDARSLALQVADNPNIDFVNPATEAQLRLFASGGRVFNACGDPMTVSKHLLSALQANSTKYKILINNIGFKQDRAGVGCERGTLQHPKGTAVDLNDIIIIGGASTGGSISLPGSDLAIVNQYATDFLAALPPNRGGVGQKDHGVNPTFPPGSVALNGTHLFPDAGNHLHIDARNRQDLNDTE